MTYRADHLGCLDFRRVGFIVDCNAEGTPYVDSVDGFRPHNIRSTHRSSFSVQRSAFSVHCSAFIVHRLIVHFARSIRRVFVSTSCAFLSSSRRKEPPLVHAGSPLQPYFSYFSTTALSSLDLLGCYVVLQHNAAICTQTSNERKYNEGQ